MSATTFQHLYIAGGYGTIGSSIARQFRQAYPQAKITLAGRRPESGRALAQQLGNTHLANLDLEDPQLPGDVDLVIAALPDPELTLAEAAIRRGLAFVNITTAGAEEIARLADMLSLHHSHAPVVPLGYYEAGMILPLVAALAAEFSRVDRVLMTALHDPQDPLGTLSTEELSGQLPPALIRHENQWLSSDRAMALTLESGESVDSVPFTTLDNQAVAALTAAPNIRLGVAGGLSRGSRLHNQPSIELYIDIDSCDAAGNPQQRRMVASDPRGQAHFTGLGVMAVIRALNAGHYQGVVAAEDLLANRQTLDWMVSEGIELI